MKLFLASKSKQRRDILKNARVRFKTVNAPYVEKIQRGESPAEAARRLALGKARAARLPRNTRDLSGAIVIGADTLIAFGGKILGKPASRTHARRMLQSFSGRPQWVLTGVALVHAPSGKSRVFVERSKVIFKKMTASDIETYLDTGEYRGKAGAFGLQGKGAHLIDRTSGSTANIVGFPIERFRVEFARFKRAI